MCDTTSLRRYRLIISASDKCKLISHLPQKDFTIKTVVVTTERAGKKTSSGAFYPEFANSWQMHSKTVEGLGNKNLMEISQ